MMEEFPSFRRLDVHLWSRSKFYPGCFIMLIPRALWIFFWWFSIGFWYLILFAGKKSFDTPLTGWRRTAHKWMLWTHVPMMILGFGYYIDHTSHSEESVDYSKYLGPDWRKNKFDGKRVSTLIANHVTFIDIGVWCTCMTPPAFTPASFVQKLRMGDFYCRALNCLYIDRSSSKEGLDRTVNQMMERQRLIEKSDLDWGPICIFAEGSVTNGKNLSRFRRGGFQANVAV